MLKYKNDFIYYLIISEKRIIRNNNIIFYKILNIVNIKNLKNTAGIKYYKFIIQQLLPVIKQLIKNEIIVFFVLTRLNLIINIYAQQFALINYIL